MAKKKIRIGASSPADSTHQQHRTGPLVPNAEGRSARDLRAFLLVDLATFPPSFQRRLRVEAWSDNDVLWRCCELQRLEERRALAVAYERPGLPRPRLDFGPPFRGGCGCGCHGLNSELGSYLQGIREALHGLRARTARIAGLRTEAARRRNRQALEHCRSHLRRAKRELVEWLWTTGQRTIDRRALTQHVIEEAKLQIEAHEAWITDLEHEIRLRHGRLERGVYSIGRRRGQSISLGYRETIEREIGDRSAWIAQARARIAELGELVTFDVPRLVRQYTGCERTEH